MRSGEMAQAGEWIDDEKERNRRLGQLGLSQYQTYEDLSDQEKRFLDMDEQHRWFIQRSFDGYRMNHYGDLPAGDEGLFKQSYIRSFMTCYDSLSRAVVSPNPDYSDDLNLALADAIVNLGVPFKEIEKSMPLMGASDTPNFIKQMTAFKILYPDLKAAFEHDWVTGGARTAYNDGGYYLSSPVLRRAIGDGVVYDEDGKSYDAEELIYRQYGWQAVL